MAEKMCKLNKKADKGILKMCPDASYVIICSPGGKSEVCITSQAKKGKVVDGDLNIKDMKTLTTKPIIINSLTDSYYEFICDGVNYYLVEC